MRHTTTLRLTRVLWLLVLILGALLSGSPAGAYQVGDVNDDTVIDLKDALLSLQVVSGRTPGGQVFTEADADGDGKIGLAETIFILQYAAANPPTCQPGTSGGAVQAPQFVRNISGQTSWYASPLVIDLNHDGQNELVAGYYSLFVYDRNDSLLSRADGNGSRIYAPFVVTDLEGDGVYDIVCGQGKNVYAYEWWNNTLRLKSGLPADTTRAGGSPEVRGLAAADLDGDGAIEVVATTTQTRPASAGGLRCSSIIATPLSTSPPGFPTRPGPATTALPGQEVTRIATVPAIRASAAMA